MAGALLFVGAAFLILLYLAGISAGKGFAIFISSLYFVVPFFLLSVENIRKALLIFSRTVADYLADYGQSKNIFHRILQNTSVDMQTGNVEFLPFVVGILGITLWLILVMALLWKVHPCILFFVVAICFAFPFFVWGIRPELFAVLSFLIFCFFLFSSSFWGGVLGTAVIIIVLLLGTFFGMTNTGQMSAVQKNWNKERYKEQESVLPEGQLTKAKKMKRTDEEALKVNIYKKNSYYLKGFVGTTYENNCWKASTNNWNIFGSDRSMLAASDREAYESLLWLHNKEFYGNTVMYHFVRQKKLLEGKTDPSLYSLSVKNVGANRKYFYLPYESAVLPTIYEEEGTAAINKTENIFASGIKGAGEDNWRGLSAEDIAHIIGEKVYDSRAIGMKDAADPEELKENKGSGFGLMNSKGIIEKYKKTNELFRVCVFDIESEPGKGSRFYFRLPSGVRKVIGVLLCLLLPLGMASCLHEPLPSILQDSDSIAITTDSTYEDLLDAASDYANAAYFANVDENYEIALQYIDSAMMSLNEHYKKYTRTPKPHRYMKLVGKGTPAELFWWNELFDSDYHVILDIRNEAAVAFLALKQIDAYSYNNSAFTDLYKVQGEDQTLEGYCRQLERSNTNKTVGIILCFVLLIVSLIGYYLLYMRKMLQNRLNLEQVLEINQKVFAASLVRPQTQENEEALQREENTLKEIPQRIVNEAFGSVNELLTISLMGIAVYNETTHRLEYASCPGQEMPEMVQQCFETGEYLSEQNLQAIPLMVEAGGEHQCVGVLYLERREGTQQETDHLLFELVARYVSIVVFNAVVKLATQYRDIESAHEETRRASWEDSMLHVQNMVLDIRFL